MTDLPSGLAINACLVRQIETTRMIGSVFYATFCSVQLLDIHHLDSAYTIALAAELALVLPPAASAS